MTFYDTGSLKWLEAREEKKGGISSTVNMICSSRKKLNSMRWLESNSQWITNKIKKILILLLHDRQ